MSTRRLTMYTALATVTVVALTAAAGPARDYPITPVPFHAVKIGDGFWQPRFETNRAVTVGYDFRKCEETARIANFARASGLEKGKFEGIPFNDSDVYKVIEGAAYTLALHPDAELDRYLDGLIAKIAAAQEKDGYLYTARTLGFTNGMTGPERWSNLGASHELYNVGHLYEAAAAHFNATGKRALLDVALRNADLLCRTFGPAEGQLKRPPGHQEIEIGLAKLYRVTGERKYLDLAKFFLDIRGRADRGEPLRGPYQQDHLPVVDQAEAVGHAVRACYMYAGMADVAALTGDEAYIRAIDRLWDNVVAKKIYVTGGVGARHAGEAFGDAYELPNATAYNETCAAIACGLWAHRMFLLHGDAAPLDVLERILYNGFLSGIALSGDRFFYPNPLAADGKTKFNHGDAQRAPWFGCSCCPVNVVRIIPSIAGFTYAQKGDSAYVNLFVSGEGALEAGGVPVRLSQQTRYPWDGRVRIDVHPKAAAEFALRVRIPGWARGRPLPSDLYRYVEAGAADGVKLAVNGKAQELKLEQGFAVLRRTWKPGDRVELDLPMPVRRVAAREEVQADRGRVALERGPVVYCVEGADHDGRALNLVLPDEAKLAPEPRPDLLGGVTVLRGEGRGAFRREDGSVELRPAALTAIPYYAWCHRGPNEMQVWLPRTAEGATPAPRPTLAAQARVSASYGHAQDTTSALNDQAEPRNSGDHDLPRFTWWDHRGTEEWVQYDLPQRTKVSAAEVYWFDDTGRGQCRVPASATLFYREGEAWIPVKPAAALGVAADRFNRIEFTPVKTDGLRLEVQLQPGMSGGILEWRLQGGAP